MKKWVVLFTSLFSFLFASEQGFIEHNGNQIEFFLEKPTGDGPFPVIFMVHGYQPLEKSCGGAEMIEHGVAPFIEQNIAIVSISLPGFGNSSGTRDFAGPSSQKAVIAVMEYFKQLPFINREKIGLYGGGLGAIVASMVSTVTPDLTFQILQSGAYDISLWFAQLPSYLDGIKQNFEKETDNTDEAFEMRSATRHADLIKAPTLILDCKYNDRRGLITAQILQEKLLYFGTDCHLITYHKVDQKWSAILPFVRKWVFNLYGIGVGLTNSRPVIQIQEIFSNSPADLSEHLKIGDAILAVSPYNNEDEISTFNLSVDEVASLIVGEKGTSVRLRVQHFDDLTIEDIVIERGDLYGN